MEKIINKIFNDIKTKSLADQCRIIDEIAKNEESKNMMVRSAEWGKWTTKNRNAIISNGRELSNQSTMTNNEIDNFLEKLNAILILNKLIS